MLSEKKKKKGKVSFGEFINHLDMYKHQTKPKWLKYGAYSLKDWIYDKNGKMLVDKVFKLENLDEFMDKMKQMGIHVNSIPILNQRTNLNEYRKHYNNKMRTIIEKMFKYEIDKFNYTF